jgi:hypothetical protein
VLFKQAIKNKLIEGAALAADAKVDGREIGRTLLAQIAGQTNDVSKRKIARGPVSNLILEVVEGLWENDVTALADELERIARNLRGAVRPAGSQSSTESKKTTNVSPGNTSTR